MIIKICKFECGCIGIPLEKFNSGGTVKALILEGCDNDESSLSIQTCYYNIDEPMEMDLEGLELVLQDLRAKMITEEVKEIMRNVIHELQRIVE